MHETGGFAGAASTGVRTWWPTRREWWASTRSRGSWTTSSARRSDHALRLLAPGLRGMAPERPRRADGGELGLREPSRAAERTTRLRRDAHCRSEEHTSELQSRSDLVCRLLLEKKKTINKLTYIDRIDLAI